MRNSHFFRVALFVFLGVLSNLLCGQNQASSTEPQTQIWIYYSTDPKSTLTIRGDEAGLSWHLGVPCQKVQDGLWTWKTNRSFSRLSFKILYQDQLWSVGANYQVKQGETLTLYPFFGNQRGTLFFLPRFWSPELKNYRTLRLYLPPSYLENKQKHYPVLYVQDGQNLFESKTSAFGVEWELDENLDQLIRQGQMDEIIVVGIDHMGMKRLFEYTPKSEDYPGSGGSGLYQEFVIKTIKPYIDTHYRTCPEPNTSGIMGSSLGGLIAFESTNLGIFGKIASLSGSFWWNEEASAQKINQMSLFSTIQFYLDAGTVQDGLVSTQRMAEVLRTQGYSFMFYQEEGGRHQEAYWAKRVWRPLCYFFPFQSTFYAPPSDGK